MVWAACVNRENLLNADWLRFLPELNIENLVFEQTVLFLESLVDELKKPPANLWSPF